MKSSIVILILLFSHMLVFSQKVFDFKIKTKENSQERTEMLDLFRAELKDSYKTDFIFVVDHFKVCGDFAWFKGLVQRKDGREIELLDDTYDCCHVEALYKKNKGKWLILESGAFSTDVWWDGIWERTTAPTVIFE
jgi:hypothetical protein